MKFFHKHKWEIIAKIYAPPNTPVGFECNDMTTVNRVLFGYTTIIFQCSDPNCRKLRREEMLGTEMEKNKND
jgi:hypothetical protein